MKNTEIENAKFFDEIIQEYIDHFPECTSRSFKDGTFIFIRNGATLRINYEEKVKDEIYDLRITYLKKDEELKRIEFDHIDQNNSTTYGDLYPLMNKALMLTYLLILKTVKENTTDIALLKHLVNN